MNRRFECLPAGFFESADGTLVNPFLNPQDSNRALNDLGLGGLGGLGIAAGQIDPGIISEIHFHPFVAQVTLLLSGALDIHMKDADSPAPPYCQTLTCHEVRGEPGCAVAAVVTAPRTFFQLDNTRSEQSARVLYVTSPAYVLEASDDLGSSGYDDAIMLGRDWERLAAAGWHPPELDDPAYTAAARHDALARIVAANAGRR